jgi:hypothetical protein
MGRLLNKKETGAEKPKNNWGDFIDKWDIKEMIPEERLLEILEGTGLGQSEPSILSSGDTKD